MSIAADQPITTINIHAPASEKVTAQGPLPWLSDSKTETSAKAETENADTSWGGDGFGFDDFLDLINPLQHLPIVGSVYRNLTGDEIADEARLIGGGLLGGPVGLMASAASMMVEEVSGDDVFGHVASLFEEDAVASQEVQLATAAPRNLMGNLPPAPQWAEQETAQAEPLEPLDFGPVDGKAAPEPYLPAELPEDRAVLSLFAPAALLDAQEDYTQNQTLWMAQEVASELGS